MEVIIELYHTVNGTFHSATSHEPIKEIPLGTNREFSLNYAKKCSLSKYNSELYISRLHVKFSFFEQNKVELISTYELTRI